MKHWTQIGLSGRDTKNLLTSAALQSEDDNEELSLIDLVCIIVPLGFPFKIVNVVVL